MALVRAHAKVDHDAMTKQITVGYDGTVPSSEAVRSAAAEASHRGAALRIITCYDLPLIGDALVGAYPANAYTYFHVDAEGRVNAIRDIIAAAYPGVELDAI